MADEEYDESIAAMVALHERVLFLELALDQAHDRERSLRATIHQLQSAALFPATETTTCGTVSGSVTSEEDLRERPVLDSASRGDTMALRMLLQSRHGHDSAASVHRRKRRLPDLALIAASAGGHLDSVRFLVDEAGADVHAFHDSALLWACRNGSVDLAEYLLDKGADVNSLERCCIGLASSRGHSDVVDLLLKHTIVGFS